MANIELLPATTRDLVNKSSPLKVNILFQGSRTCLPNHPDAKVIGTECVFRYHNKGFASNPSRLPETFNAVYKFSDDTSYNVSIRKSILSDGSCEFWFVPDCKVKVMEVFYNIRQRRHKVTQAGRRMTSIKRKIGYPTQAQFNGPIHTHRCIPGSADCSPVESPIDPDQSNVDNPNGSPMRNLASRHNVVAIPAFVGSKRNNPTGESRKRSAEGDLYDPRPLKAARTEDC